MERRSGDEGNEALVRSELYFLIAKYLSEGPCRRSAEELKRELEEHELLPKRLDWQGGQHPRSFDDLVNSNLHIASNHLLRVCQQIGPLLDKDVRPGVSKVHSLLGSGRQSLLRTKDDITRVYLSLTKLSARRHGCPLSLPPNLTRLPNSVQILTTRELSGPLTCQQLMPSKFYRNVQQFCRRLGHLSSVYCVLFDRTGRYIFTGADDLLVKIWSVQDGRLMETLRGHSAEITDLAVNYENTLLAAGSCDKIIRVWCLKTVSPVAVLAGHTGMITSLQFCPSPKGEDRYLVSTGTDGCIYFWLWNVSTTQFNPQPRKFTDRNRPGAQLICASFSPGGNFVVTGSTDHHVRIYNVFGQGGPEKINEVEAHSDRVDSIQFANNSERFVSGSRDGTANIWRLERQKWKSMLLRMSTRLPGDPPQDLDDTKVAKFKVTMVGWDLEDRHVITAVNDFSLKVWDSYSGKLIYRLEGHDDEAFVLESHPTDPRIILSAGHDGRIILWDLTLGVPVKKFFNVIEGQGHGAVFDCKFSPEGNFFASTDSHGHLCVFGYGSNEKYKKLPDELFFHTDYRPLIRDSNHHVLDEQTQQAPHLMPPPFLVNIDGNPYPPELQRFVPGREHCKDSQLVPYVVVNAGGDADVFDVNDTDNQRPSIDVMIQRLRFEQAVRRGPPQQGQGPVPGPLSPRAVARPPNPMVSPPHGLVGMRRSGDVEGVRQSQGDWQGSSAPTQGELLAWSRRVTIPSLQPNQLKHSENLRLALGEQEVQRFKKVERRRRSEASEGDHSYHHRRPKAKLKRVVSIPIRPLKISGRDTNRMTSGHSSSSEGENAWDSSSDSDTESSEYSDWTQDAGINLKPPKRNRQALARNKRRPMRIVDDDEHQSERPAPTSKKKRQDANRNRIENDVPALPEADVPEADNDAGAVPQRSVEIPLAYRPPEWLTGTVPRKAPYYPQMGDEVIYFQQGHRCYVDAVKRARVYVIAEKNQPWRTMTIREQELVKVVGIKYEIRPPRLCCLKLAMIDPETSKMNGQTFTIKYHDVPDVIDFLVLRQTYDTAMSRNWKQGDRFRSMIDDAWWVGTIESHEPFQEDYPDSMFQCFNVAWDNGEREKMSPWDLEPIDDQRMPTNIGGSIEVLPEELKSLLYKPQRGEWPEHDMDEECDRIIRGLEQVMELAIAEPFTAPVDLNSYPSYARIVEYPVDLGIVKARLENRFYRRVTSIQFDVRYVESNARKFNEGGSVIVKQARIVTDLCLKLIEDSMCTEIKALYQELTENADSDENAEVHVDTDSDTHIDYSSEDDVAISMRKLRMKKDSKDSEVDLTNEWKNQCKELVSIIYACEDSEAFRRPVDPVEYPHYREIIDIPMDFGTVREQLYGDHYASPIEFCKDVRLIFQNSRNYNTNKKSRIYSMTIRLSAMFEDQIRSIISDWRSVMTYEQRIKNNQYVSNRRKPLPQLKPEMAQSSSRSSSHRGQSQPSTSSSGRSRNGARKSSRRNWKSRKNSSYGKSKSSRRRHPIKRRKNAKPVPRKKKAVSEEEEDDSDDEQLKENLQKANPARRLTRSQQTGDQPKRPRSSRIANGHATRPVRLRSLRNPSRVIVESDANGNDSDDDTENSSQSEAESPPEPRTKGKAPARINRNTRATRKVESRASSRESQARPGSSSSGASRASRVQSSRSSKTNSGSSSSSSGSGSSSSSSSSDEDANNKKVVSGDDRAGNSSASASGSNDRDDGEGDDYAVRRSKRTYTRYSTMATRNAASARRSQEFPVERSCSRGVKRRRVETDREEEEEEDDDNDEEDDDNDGPSASRRSKRIATRNLGKRTVRYREDSDFEYDFDTEQNNESAENDNDEPEPTLSISSRGRIRKLTPIARSFIRR